MSCAAAGATLQEQLRGVACKTEGQDRFDAFPSCGAPSGAQGAVRIAVEKETTFALPPVCQMSAELL